MLSQTIKGVVKDSVTGEPISYANILLKHGKGTYSDTLGHFELTTATHSDSLKVSSLGYASKELILADYKNAHSIEILLNPKIEELNDVLIFSKKITYTDKELLGEKKEGNIGVSALPGYETAIYIENPRKTTAKLKRVYIDVKKRKNANLVATLNIKVYELDTINNQPGEPLYSKNIYITPKNKTYRLWVDVEDLGVFFPENGVCIGVEMINPFGKDKASLYFGPMFRYTLNDQRIYKTWSNYHYSGWKGSSLNHKKFKRYKTGVSNPMIGVEVLFPK